MPSALGKVPKYSSNDRFSCMTTITCLILWMPEGPAAVCRGVDEPHPASVASPNASAATRSVTDLDKTRNVYQLRLGGRLTLKGQREDLALAGVRAVRPHAHAHGHARPAARADPQAAVVRRDHEVCAAAASRCRADRRLDRAEVHDPVQTV